MKVGPPVMSLIGTEHPLCETADLPAAIDLPCHPPEKIMLLQDRQVVWHITIWHALLPPCAGSRQPTHPKLGT
jgi:hypothetical protein